MSSNECANSATDRASFLLSWANFGIESRVDIFKSKTTFPSRRRNPSLVFEMKNIRGYTQHIHRDTEGRARSYPTVLANLGLLGHPSSQRVLFTAVSDQRKMKQRREEDKVVGKRYFFYERSETSRELKL